MQRHLLVLRLAKIEQRIGGRMIEVLQEIEDRKEYVEWGYSDLYTYLTEGVGLSEATAYQRKAAVKILNAIPDVKEKLDDGRLSYSNIAKAYKVIRRVPMQEKKAILQSLEMKTKKEAVKILEETAPELYLAAKKHHVMEFSEEEFQKIEKLKALKSHQASDIKEFVMKLVERELDKYDKTSEVPSKSQNPRQIKASTRNLVFKRAGYKCQWPGCNETHFLQVDHIMSVANGGSNEPENLQALCSNHNQYKGAG